MTTRTAVRAIAAFALAAGVAGGPATGRAGEPNETGKTTAGAQAKRAREPVPDGDVTAAVERQLQRDALVPFDGIDVDTAAGIVALSGTVDSLLAKDRAAAVARGTRGVRAVVNELTVRAPGRTDEQVRADVVQALAADPAADSFELAAAAEGGTVTLTGTVDSWAERRVSEQVARGVRGVTAVRNRITVDTQTERGDAEVAADVRTRLAWDRSIDDAKIDVRVTDGTVTLTGTVGSAAERWRALGAGWVAGTKAVNGDGLKVDEWWDRAGLRRTPAGGPSDADIKEAVRDAFVLDPRVLSFKPTVRVVNGVVTLTGTVDNLAAKRAAGSDARNVVGVRNVWNLLKVRPAVSRADADIARDVRTALTRDPYVDRYEVTVKAFGGYVYLTGAVDSYTARARVGDIAARVNGVKRVRNFLTVERPVMTADVPDISTSDIRTREAIKDEMWWSPFVDADEVVVTVRDGVATLNGFVDTWSERPAAPENAFVGGARRVINELKVRSGPDYERP